MKSWVNEALTKHRYISLDKKKIYEEKVDFAFKC